MKIGDRVIFKEDWDIWEPILIFPLTIIKKGRTGTFVEADLDGSHWVLLDTPEEALNSWDNKVQLGNDERKVDDYLEVIQC